MGNPVRVAVTQAEPVWTDLAGAVVKTCALIAEAAENGAQLVAFPETWIPGYPCWIWHRLLDPDLYVRYSRNALKVDSPEMARIQGCAREHSIVVLLGFAENYHDTLFIAQALITPDGDIGMWRRKMKPTHMERTVFGDASTDCLKSVTDTPLGRVGSLACWEHTQPLLKFQTMDQREAIHVSAWPPVFPYVKGLGPWSMSAEACRSLSQTYAIESGSFVLHCTAVLTERGIKAMGTAGGAIMAFPGGGDSAIFSPEGERLTEPTDAATETILYANLDMDESVKARIFADGMGHYSRPDLFCLLVRDEKRPLVHYRVEKDTIESEADQASSAHPWLCLTPHRRACNP